MTAAYALVRMSMNCGARGKFAVTPSTLKRPVSVGGPGNVTVAILAGHCDPSTLAKTYQHLSHAPEFLKQSLRRNVG